MKRLAFQAFVLRASPELHVEINFGSGLNPPQSQIRIGVHFNPLPRVHGNGGKFGLDQGRALDDIARFQAAMFVARRGHRLSLPEGGSLFFEGP